MESTGVYWIPLYELLEERGFEVLLVNAAHARNVPGRKSDVLDCQWLQELHTFGLLRASFRPEAKIAELRTYTRHRHTLIEEAARQIQRMQKSLDQMNVQVHHVLADLTSKTGMAIVRDIVAGNHDPERLAQITGGRSVSGRRPPSANRAALVLRQAASSIGRTQTAVGAFYRRIAARRSKPIAVVATARKLACAYYRLIRDGAEYVEHGADAAERDYQNRRINHLHRLAKTLRFSLQPIQPEAGVT